MLCAVIKGPSLEQVRDQLNRAQQRCYTVELRLDYFKNVTFDQLKKLCLEYTFPMIFTLRPASQGGAYEKSEDERLTQIKKLAALRPAYMDLEYTVDPCFIKALKAQFPDIKIIISFHDFDKMPALAPLLNQLKRLKADLYKMAVVPHSSAEALSLLTFMRDNQPDLLVMGMGLYGEVTRILSPIYGGIFTYAALEKELSSAPGQLTVDQLSSIYHHENLNPETKIYGLIGDPITKSIGYQTLNAVMDELHLPATYVNFPVSKNQLKEFILQARNAGLSGLSITMPLKEDILPMIDEIDPWAKEVGAVNTLIFTQNGVKGYNTDGKGAVDAIEEKTAIQGKKIVIIGAGGAPRAIVKQALDRGAHVVILNRHPERALSLANEMGCSGGSIDLIAEEASQGYDILINATPSSMPIDSSFILPKTVVMDINTLALTTPFLESAREKGCTIISGYSMYINQAAEQFLIWFEMKNVKSKIKKEVLKVLSANIHIDSHHRDDGRTQLVKNVRRWGGLNSDVMLDPNCKFFSVPSVEGFIGYRIEAKSAIVFGDPVCAIDDQCRLAEAFQLDCREKGLNVIYAIASDHFAKVINSQPGHVLIQFGNKLILDPSDSPLKRSGSNGILLRKKVKHALKEGIVVHEYLSHEASIEKSIEQVGHSWLQSRRGPQVFIAHLNLFNDREGKRWFYAIDKDRVVGFLLLNEIQASSGWLLNNLILSPDAPSGTSELLITSALEVLEKENSKSVVIGPVTSQKISIAGLGTFFSWFVNTVFRTSKKIFKLDGQRVFWDKFQPHGEPSYLIFDKVNIRTTRALMRAMNIKI